VLDEIRPQYVLDAPDANALFASEIVRANGSSIASTINQLENAAISDLYSEWALALPSYSDQVLPFNVTLAGANEYGAMCASKIWASRSSTKDPASRSTTPSPSRRRPLWPGPSSRCRRSPLP
jgi:hypothetical protein